MNKEEYQENRKEIALSAATITSIVVGLLFEKNKLFIVSSAISDVIADVFLFVGYCFILIIAQSLKDKNIHGIRAIAWSAFLLHSLCRFIPNDASFWIVICNVISIIIALFFLIEGVIRLIYCIYYRVKRATGEQEIIVKRVEIVVAIVTAIVAVGVSLIEMLTS